MSNGLGNKVVVFGATSAIAAAFLRQLTHKELCLVGRNLDRLEDLASDLTVRGAKNVKVVAGEVGQSNSCEALLQSVNEVFGDFDSVLVAYGSLPDQHVVQDRFEKALEALEVNFLSVIALLTPIINKFEELGKGCIIVIGSVAGDRGRQSNYIYGCAKGALETYLQGVRNRVFKRGVKVITVKPGFVDTPMTAHLKKGPLFASPESVANGIIRAVDKGKDVVYLPWFWSIIMTIIKFIPEFIFKRLSL